MNRMKLSEEKIQIINEQTKKTFEEKAKVYIFGSGADLRKKCGDIFEVVKTLDTFIFD